MIFVKIICYYEKLKQYVKVHDKNKLSFQFHPLEKIINLW